MERSLGKRLGVVSGDQGNRLKREEEAAEPEPEPDPEPTEEDVLLTEIRDLLRAGGGA